MTQPDLGRLEPVRPRDIWPNEATDFTPWLAQVENLKLLGDTLVMELQLESQEKDVGPYRADIVCRDTADESWVLVENQLAPTDHTHLGQILTYAAGLSAVTVVWIAERFTDEHRAAMDWLNEISGDNVQFFGLEVEVWRIGDSPIAPKFNVVAKPNDWTKGRGKSVTIRTSELTESRRIQLEFWKDFREYVLDRETVIKPTKPLPQNWMNIAIGRSGFKLTAIASLYDNESGGYDSHEVRAEFEIFDRDNAKGYYRALEADRQQIEEDVGETLTWYNPDTANLCRIYLRRAADLGDPEARDELYGWLLSKLEALHRGFAHRIKDLEPLEAELDTSDTELESIEA